MKKPVRQLDENWKIYKFAHSVYSVERIHTLYTYFRCNVYHSKEKLIWFALGIMIFNALFQPKAFRSRNKQGI